LFRRTWQSPSNAHAYRLYIFNEPARSSGFAPSLLANPAAISEAFDYDRFFEALSSCFLLFRLRSARFARVAVVISEALDSIPTFDRPSNRLSFSFSAALLRFRAAVTSEARNYSTREKPRSRA
jgi:hypothetical protein